VTEKKFIIFTDLKDFTYKNALLTSLQIQEMLSRYDQYVREASEMFHVKILKSIGDAYLLLCEDSYGAYHFAIKLIELTEKYDGEQKLDLKKISLRITITYGSITRNTSLDLEDYF